MERCRANLRAAGRRPVSRRDAGVPLRMRVFMRTFVKAAGVTAAVAALGVIVERTIISDIPGPIIETSFQFKPKDLG